MTITSKSRISAFIFVVGRGLFWAIVIMVTPLLSVAFVINDPPNPILDIPVLMVATAILVCVQVGAEIRIFPRGRQNNNSLTGLKGWACSVGLLSSFIWLLIQTPYELRLFDDNLRTFSELLPFWVFGAFWAVGVGSTASIGLIKALQSSYQSSQAKPLNGVTQ